MKKTSVILIVALLTALQFNASATSVSPSFKGVQTESDSLALVEFTGTYKFKENPTVQKISVAIVKNALVSTDLDTNDAYNLKADAEKADTFSISAIGAEVVFVRDENKKITGIKVVIGDDTLVGEKEK
jgi:hypothetical protein